MPARAVKGAVASKPVPVVQQADAGLGYQLTHDDRMRTVGEIFGRDTFAGVQFRGYIYPLNTPPPSGVDTGVHIGVSSPSALAAAKTTGDFGGAGQGGDGVKFLFNPSSIDMTYSSTNALLPYSTLDASQQGQPMGNNGPTISFDLLFDRTYDVMAGNMLGVQTDILALERMCGMTDVSPVMVLSPVVVMLNSTQQFIFRALLTGMHVQYTHFSQYMVPMRCGVSITAQRISSLTNLSQAQYDAYNARQTDDSKKLDKSVLASPPQTQTPTTQSAKPSNTAWVSGAGNVPIP